MQGLARKDKVDGAWLQEALLCLLLVEAEVRLGILPGSKVLLGRSDVAWGGVGNNHALDRLPLGRGDIQKPCGANATARADLVGGMKRAFVVVQPCFE